MTKTIALRDLNQGTALRTGTLPLAPLVIEGLTEFRGSFDRLCLRAGVAAIEAMLAGDAERLCGKRYERRDHRQGHRWGGTRSEIGYHGGKAAIRRPRVRGRGGAELGLASWQAIKDADLLSRWAFNQMLIGVTTRKYRRSVRLPDGDLAGEAKRATAKSSVSRRFVALSTAKLKEWLAADLSALDLLVIQIDGLAVGDCILVAAIGIDATGEKHVLALVEGATENAAVVKALLADLVERGLQPDLVRLFIVDGAKALSRAVRNTFGRFALIQRCQVHKGRNIIERLDPALHAGVKKVLRQAWDSPTADQAERVLKNLARRLEREAPGVSASIHEGLDEMLTVIRLGLPDPLRRALGCTNAIESLMAVIRQVCRNVKRWRDAKMALRWTGTAMLEAKKTFRRLKAHKHLPVLKAALRRHQQALLGDPAVARLTAAA
ncbi:MAG: IS256 family transposase [Pseudomonadota bacterium]